MSEPKICVVCDLPIIEGASVIDDGDHLCLNCAAEEADNVGFDGWVQDQQ